MPDADRASAPEVLSRRWGGGGDTGECAKCCRCPWPGFVGSAIQRGGSAWYPLSTRRCHRGIHAEGRAADVLECIDRDRDLALPSPMALQSLSDSTGASADAMRRLTTASMVYKAVGHAPR